MEMMAVIDLKPKEVNGPFVVGSTVALKGGGAVMTVRKPGKQAVVCDWHDAAENLCSADFPPAMLRHADPDEEVKEKDATDGGG